MSSRVRRGLLEGSKVVLGWVGGWVWGSMGGPWAAIVGFCWGEEGWQACNSCGTTLKASRMLAMYSDPEVSREEARRPNTGPTLLGGRVRVLRIGRSVGGYEGPWAILGESSGAPGRVLESQGGRGKECG